MIRRINIMGGPGCGKSTAAAYVFSSLKKEGYSIEFVDEYVKSWAYEKRVISSFDQAYIFMQQLRKEYLVLNNDDGCIVTDSPLNVSICYAKQFGFKKWHCLQEIADEFEKEYPSINICLSRDDCEYKNSGRYQNIDEAIIMDNVIKDHIVNVGLDFCSIKYNDHQGMVEWVANNLKHGAQKH